MQKSTLVLVIGLAGACGFAIAYGARDAGANSVTIPQASTETANGTGGTGGMGGDGVDPSQQLPPNHPSIGQGGGGAMGGGPVEAPALSWKAPKEWSSAPNPNPMRLATYKLPQGDGTELIVARAGGDVATNVARWGGQFDGSPTPKQTQKTVHDLKVTIVQIEGTYQGGMGQESGSHAGWSLLGAIVETQGEAYFFKVLGPAATVRAARKPFEAMIDGVSPT